MEILGMSPAVAAAGLLLLLGGAMAVAWPLMQQGRERSGIKRRLHVEPARETGNASPAAAGAAPEAGKSVRQKARKQALKTAQEFYSNSDSATVAKLRARLIKAGFLDPGAVGMFFLARVVGLVAGIALGAVLGLFLGFEIGGNRWTPMLLFGIFGYFFADLALMNITRKRHTEYRNGFPDFMDLMVVCSDAGMSMEAAIERVSREIAKTYPALSQNLQLVSIELRAGRNINDALKALGDRLGLDEVRSFATLLQQSKELGTSLSNALRVFSDEMRHKRMSMAEEKAHALPAKMSVPVTACILPVVLLVAIIPIIVQFTGE